MQRQVRDAVIPSIALDTASGPLYQQIYDGYRLAILEGRLRPGQRVPSTRALALQLGISRLPVLTAFEQLQHEGYIEGRAGSGTYVASSILDPVDAAGSGRRPQAPVRKPRQSRARRDVELPHEPADSGAFRVSLPALDQFPNKTWARLVSRHARRMPVESMAYGDPAGHLPLRHAIADYLRAARAVACDASQVLIVSGSQMALQLCARVLLKPGDAFCFEDPGYPGARNALGATGAVLRTVPVDGEGLVVRSMGTGKQAARLAYVTPSHQYPTGVVMSLARRLELLAWAERTGGWIVEDDYDGEYRYSGAPLAPLAALDRHGRVLYVGTFGKVAFPALRLGYLVLPAALVDAFAQRRAVDVRHSEVSTQAVMAEFMAAGHFQRHIRRMRRAALSRRNTLLANWPLDIPGVGSLPNVAAGLHLTVAVDTQARERELIEAAARVDVEINGLSSYWLPDSSTPADQRAGLVLGFAAVPEAAIESALARLRSAWCR